MPFTVLVAPSGFKESLDVTAVTDAIAAGLLRARSNVRILKAPMVDGGEGFTKTLVDATRGKLYNVPVVGPVGQPVDAFIGVLGGKGPKTVILEMAAAAGLSLVPRTMRDPTITTSFGVGQLIKAALDLSPARILIGCGDSGINDGGIGMAQALGVGIFDAEGRQIGFGGRHLGAIKRIDISQRDPRLAKVKIDAAVNWHNQLLGPQGVARVFAPQKGATPEQVIELERGLENYARILLKTTHCDVGNLSGAGASGGLGAGLAALVGAQLHPRFDIVMDYLKFDRMLGDADLVITAEGSLDGQTPRGKIPAEVGRRARQNGIPVIALAGTIGKGVRENFDHGIDAFASIIKRPCTLTEAIEKAEKLLTNAAEDALRMVLIGTRLRVAASR